MPRNRQRKGGGKKLPERSNTNKNNNNNSNSSSREGGEAGGEKTTCGASAGAAPLVRPSSSIIISRTATAAARGKRKHLPLPSSAPPLATDVPSLCSSENGMNASTFAADCLVHKMPFRHTISPGDKNDVTKSIPSHLCGAEASSCGGQIPPGNTAESPAHHLCSVGSAVPPGGGCSSARWTRRLFSLMLAREKFDDIQEARSVSVQQVRTFRVVDRLVPSFAKRPAFYILDFFTHRRVMLVLLLIALLLGYYSFHKNVWSLTASFSIADEDRPGLRFLQNHTIRKRHPVMIIPGFISTALEVWQAHLECIDAHQSFTSDFRQRMFSPRFLLLLITDPACYLELFSLDKRTGFDPPGVKIRPDMGFGASDFFLPGYWVWAKVLVNLADIGYDPQSMGVFSYDWRLSPRRMHRRDGYYYYLRNHLMYLFEKNKERVVVISHSYGTNVVIDFFRWVEKRTPGWTDKYVAYWINIGGPVMGVAKSVSAILTGDARDTLTLPSPARQLLETHLSRSLRTQVLRSWSCQTAMFPVGCNDIFPDILTLPNGTQLSSREVLQFTAQQLHESGHVAQEQHVYELLDHFDKLPSLPLAPRMTVLCLYGVDLLTEAGYILGDGNVVNLSYHQEERATNGVILENGDGTVPLMSLAYMCRAKNGWKQDVGRVITREHKHSMGSMMDLRGGPKSGDHVDILGNYELLETILKVVSGNAAGNELQDRIYTDVDDRITKATECNARGTRIPGSRRDGGVGRDETTRAVGGEK